MNKLTLATLRRANILRLPHFKDREGKPQHPNWALSAWCNAVCGELGEAANLIKKIERGDFTLDEVRLDLARELADVLTYLDILALEAGIDLGKATMTKFNEVSERIKSDVFICEFTNSKRIVLCRLHETFDIKEEAMTNDETPKTNLLPNDRVRKVGGDYSFEGVVRAGFYKRSGACRYVVEDDRGLLFIFNRSQLELIND